MKRGSCRYFTILSIAGTQTEYAVLDSPYQRGVLPSLRKSELYHSSPWSQPSLMKKLASFGPDMQMLGCNAKYACRLLVPDFPKPGTIRLHFIILFSSPGMKIPWFR